MDKRTREKVAREARVLPPLPETASKLATELHQRADAMLRVRLENIEVHVSGLVDRMIDEIARHEIQRTAYEQAKEVVRARVAATIGRRVDRFLPEIVASPAMDEWAKQEAMGMIQEHIRSAFRDRIKEAVQPVAERLVQDALEEVQRYYGATKLLATEGER